MFWIAAGAAFFLSYVLLRGHYCPYCFTAHAVGTAIIVAVASRTGAI